MTLVESTIIIIDCKVKRLAGLWESYYGDEPPFSVISVRRGVSKFFRNSSVLVTFFSYYRFVNQINGLIDPLQRTGRPYVFLTSKSPEPEDFCRDTLDPDS